jgi:hypothetical protein
MKILTTDLTDITLDWAVAYCEDKLPASYDDWRQTWPSYSTNWAAGGPVVEREWARLREQRIPADENSLLAFWLRLIVAWKLGNEVEVPDELCGQRGARRVSAPKTAQPEARPEGNWLWCELMDWCKKRGVAPAEYNDLFAIVGKARASSPPAAVPAARGPDPVTSGWLSALSDAFHALPDGHTRQKILQVLVHLGGTNPTCIGITPVQAESEAEEWFAGESVRG